MLLPSFNKWPIQEADKQIIYPVQNHALLGGTYPLRPNKGVLPPHQEGTTLLLTLHLSSLAGWIGQVN